MAGEKNGGFMIPPFFVPRRFSPNAKDPSRAHIKENEKARKSHPSRQPPGNSSAIIKQGHGSQGRGRAENVYTARLP